MKKPKQIIIEVTSKCNLKCKFCPITMKGAKPGDHMKDELFYHIIDKAAKELPESVIIPWMNGEPLLAPDYAEKIKYISSKGLSQYITTNGMIWDEELFQHLTDKNSTCYQLIFSLDGLYGKSIKGARPGSNPLKIHENIDRFLYLKKKKNATLDVAVKICRRGQDYAEVEDYIIEWVNLVDFVCVGQPLIEINENSMRQYPCQYFDNNFMVIRHDGTLTICAYNDEAVNKHVLSPGKIDLSSSLIKEYNNHRYQKLREDQNNHIFHEPCSSCGFAYTGMGMVGEVELRAKNRKLYYHSDYYNQFYSRKEKLKSNDYYRRG